MQVIETERLILRHLSTADAEFIIELLNEASFIHFIGDKGVRTIEDAQNYILNGPVTSYQQFGYGLFATQLRESGVPIGMCGILKRETLPHPDIGFAFLPAYRKQGYAFEAAAAVVDHARQVLRLDPLLAITTPDNEVSGRLLEKIGFKFDRLATLSEGTTPVKLFST